MRVQHTPAIFPRWLILVPMLALVLPVPALGQLLISEVYYCHDGDDDGHEWVEIVNMGESAVDLTGYILAGGGYDYTWSTVVLQGVISGCGTFVVGGPLSVPSNGSPVYDHAVDFDQDLQNGGLVADGVALFFPGADVTTDIPVDAVIYGTDNVFGLQDNAGLIGPPDVPTAPAGTSIERMSTARQWMVAGAPDPNGVDFESATGNCAAVAATSESWGSMKGRFR